MSSSRRHRCLPIAIGLYASSPKVRLPWCAASAWCFRRNSCFSPTCSTCGIFRDIGGGTWAEYLAKVVLLGVTPLYRKQPHAGAEAISNLMTYLRAALPGFRSAASTLADEFELARAYLELFKVRMGRRLRFTLLEPLVPRC
jgi:hypothetical protein